MSEPPFKKLDLSGATPEQVRLILKYAADVRKFEIGLFWQRSLFFWGFIGAALVAYASLDKSDDHNARIVVACFGFVCSIAWTLQNRGSKYWQEAWEQKTEAAEIVALGAKLFSNQEPRKSKSHGEWPFSARHFSVSGITTSLSDFTVVVWFCLLFAVTPFPAITCLYSLFPILAILWGFLMVFANRRRDR